MTQAEKSVQIRQNLLAERNRFFAYFLRHYTLSRTNPFLDGEGISGVDPYTLENLGSADATKRLAISQQILDHNPKPVWSDDTPWIVLADKFGFTESERAAFLLCFISRAFFSKSFVEENDYPLAVADWSGLESDAVLCEFDFSSRLYSLGLVEIPYLFQKSRLRSIPTISDFLLSFLYCRTDNPLEGYFYAPKGPGFPLESFQMDTDIIATLQRILSRGNGRILFYGEPGTGKTQLAASLAASLNRDVQFITAESDDFNFNDIILLAGLQGTQTSLLVVDEADGLLNTHARGQHRAEGALDKGLLNRWLDTYGGDFIFITNSIDYVDPSVLRRFDLVLPFDTPNAERRRTFWNQIDTGNVLGDSFRDRLARNYAVTPALIRHIVDMAAEAREAGKAGSELEAYVEKITRLKGERAFRDDQRPNPHPWKLDYLHTDSDPAALVRKVNRWLSLPPDSRTGLNILFSGPPGTGKSQFARELARLVGRPLHVKNAAELLGPFQGQTESLLQQAFDEAEEGVLLLDEADTYFTDRATAAANHVRTQVNAFLQTLENHGTICICTTNLIRNADPAVFRRFALKAAFHTLRPADRFHIVADYFPGLDWEPCRGDLESLDDLTPGDVAVVHSRAVLEDSVDTQGILDALRAELAFRPRYEKSQRRVVGFAS